MSTLTAWFDQIPGGFLVTDLTSRVLYANRAVEARTGYAAAEIIGKKPGELWGGRMPRDFYSALWQTLSLEAKPFVGRFHNQPKGKVRQWETLQIAPIKNQAGQTEFFVELHPAWRTGEEERNFHQHFLNEAGEWHHDPTTWRRFLAKLQGLDGEDALGVNLLPQADFAQFVREELVLPMQAGLARRFEDQALIRSAQADTAAFAFLYEKYVGLIEHYFLRRMESRQEAEDLAQEVFIRAFRSLAKFRVTNASYYTYLLHIAHNLLVDAYRDRNRSCAILSESLEQVAQDTAQGAVQPDLETLDMLLASLSPTERSVMLLTYRDGFRSKEVAEKLGKTENAVKLILSRSRKKLRAVLV